MNVDKLRLIRRLGGELQSATNEALDKLDKGKVGLPHAPAEVEPIAFKGETLVLFVYPESAAERVQKVAPALLTVLNEHILGVSVIETVVVSRAELMLARALANVDERLAKLEGVRR